MASAASHSEHCKVCLLRNGDHRCLECNNRYSNVEDLVRHQRERSHFGGHLVFESRRERRRRGVVRRQAEAASEAAIDAELGADVPDVNEEKEAAEDEAEQLALVGGDASLLDALDDMDVDGDEKEDEAAKDKEDAEEKKRKAVDVSELRDLDVDIAVQKRAKDDTRAVAEKKKLAGWASAMLAKYPSITFVDDASSPKKFTCKCKPNVELATGGSSSNITKHMDKCTLTVDSKQTKLFTVPVLTQKKLNELIVNFVVQTNQPLNVVESDSFHKLVTYGQGRDKVKVFSRRTLNLRVEEAYKEEVERLREVCSRAKSRFCVTFDSWTANQNRGFTGVTLTFVDEKSVLRTVLADLVFMDKSSGGATAENVSGLVAGALRSVLGDRFKDVVSAYVTDGAANVVKAAGLLGDSRRCLNHSVQLFLKGFCTSNGEVATALAMCNYFAKLGSVSQTFRSAVGYIAPAVVTRWGSYVATGKSVYDKRKQLANFVSDQRGGKASSVRNLVEDRFNMLAKGGGFALLHDMIVVLQPFVDAMFELEAEKKITASVAVPRLLELKMNMMGLFDKCDAAEHDDAEPEVTVGVYSPTRVASWRGQLTDLYNTYLVSFHTDETFLVATMLDPNFSAEALKRDPTLLPIASAALRSRLEAERTRLVGAQAELDLAVDKKDHAVDNEQAARAEAFAAAMGVAAPAEESGAAGRPGVKTVDAEIMDLGSAIGEWRAGGNPIDMYVAQQNSHLVLARAVALDVFAVPVGEAACERVFSVASRVVGKTRARMSVKTLRMLAFLKKNRLALE